MDTLPPIPTPTPAPDSSPIVTPTLTQNRRSWLVPAILIAVVLVTVPFMPSIMKNLKSSVITGQSVTAGNGAVTNLQQNPDETGGSFDVTFNTAGPSTVDVMINGERATLPVNVVFEPPNYGSGGMVPVPGAFPDETAPAQEPAGIIGVGAGGSAQVQTPEAEAEPEEIAEESEGEEHGAAELPSPFADVKEETRYRNSILTLAELGIMNGTDSPIGLVFNPVSDIDRAQFATVMNRLSNRFPELTELQADINPENCNFPDYEAEKWYIEPVTDACLKAIVEGYPDGTFKPTFFINYAEAIAVAIRAASQYSEAISVELDRQKSMRVKGEGQWYDAYVDTALELGVVTPEAWQEVENNKPWGNATRGWIADLIAHMPELP